MLHRSCCCPCYPKWLLETDSLNEPVLDSEGNPIILYSPLFGVNTWGASTYPFNTGPIPEFIRVRIRAPGGAPSSKLDNRVFDVRFASGGTLLEGDDVNPGSLICGYQLFYTGCFAIDDDIELIDGSGTVHVNSIRITLEWRVQDWGFGDCGSPQPVLTATITAETDDSGGGGYAFAGNAREASSIIRTSIADGIMNEVSAFVGWPPAPGIVIFYPALFSPGVPILISPRAADSSGNAPNGEYQYPERNRWLELVCSPRREAVEACSYEEPPSYETSSGTDPDESSSSDGPPPDESSSSSAMAGESSSSSGTGGSTLVHPRLCGTNEYQTDLFVDFIGKDDGQVYKHSDGRCVYLDLQDAELVEGTENLYSGEPLVSCASCCTCNHAGLPSTITVTIHYYWSECDGSNEGSRSCDLVFVLALHETDCYYEGFIFTDDGTGQNTCITEYGADPAGFTLFYDTANCRWQATSTFVDYGYPLASGGYGVGTSPIGTYANLTTDEYCEALNERRWITIEIE